MLIMSNKKDQEEKQIPQVPFDDALRKMLNAPPAHKIKPKSKVKREKK